LGNRFLFFSLRSWSLSLKTVAPSVLRDLQVIKNPDSRMTHITWAARPKTGQPHLSAFRLRTSLLLAPVSTRKLEAQLRTLHHPRPPSTSTHPT
jgi:hypothetical protein